MFFSYQIPNPPPPQQKKGGGRKQKRQEKKMEGGGINCYKNANRYIQSNLIFFHEI